MGPSPMTGFRLPHRRPAPGAAGPLAAALLLALAATSIGLARIAVPLSDARTTAASARGPSLAPAAAARDTGRRRQPAARHRGTP